MTRTTLLGIACLLLPTLCVSQQRIGMEFSTRLEDLSIGIQFQKVVKEQFLVGGGFLVNGHYVGGMVGEFSSLHVPFSNEVDRTTTVDGVDYQMYGYSSRSDYALSGVLMAGFFHEFTKMHGLRINLNLRYGMVHNNLILKYESVSGASVYWTQQSIWHSYQALSPEIYHTIRKSDKWTLYYGVRLPIFINFMNDYQPIYREDIYSRTMPEVAIGFSRSIADKKWREKEEQKKAEERSEEESEE